MSAIGSDAMLSLRGWVRRGPAIALAAVVCAGAMLACNAIIGLSEPHVVGGDGGVADATGDVLGTDVLDGSTADSPSCSDDLQSDDANCGACGRTCSSGCKLGRCVVTIASVADGNPSDLAVDSTSVYFTVLPRIGGFDADGGGIRRAGLDAGTSSTIVSAGESYAIAVDSTNVYWIEGGALMAAPIAGGPAQVSFLNATAR